MVAASPFSISTVLDINLTPDRRKASGASRRVQPACEVVEDQDLVKFESTAAAERLRADAELVLAVQLAGYVGPVWDAFADALAAYGFQVMIAWIVTGEVYRQCRLKGFGGSDITAPTWRVERAAAEELALETVAVSVRAFRDQVLPTGRWQAKGGASVKTYFIGQCLIRFPTVFRRWRREQQPHPSFPLTGAELRPAGASDEPETRAVAKLELQRLLRQTGGHQKQAMLILDAEGFSHPEIAEILEVSTRAVESQLYRHRAKHRPDVT